MMFCKLFTKPLRLKSGEVFNKDNPDMLTSSQLKSICIYSKESSLSRFIDPLNLAMDEFEINNVKRKSAFLAQVSHESGGFRYVEEIASGEAYDYRADLGNTKSEAVDVARRNGTTAGKWFKGHGVIQITGYYNHRDCGIALNLDLVRYPRLLVEPINACRSAAWFWDSRKLNPLADNSEFKKITKLINGGYNGLEDRTNYYLRALKIL